MSGVVTTTSSTRDVKAVRTISPLAGKPVPRHLLVDLIRLEREYFARQPPRWHRIYNAGASPQRLLWASTGTKDPKAPDVLYIKALAAPFTVNTMPEATLKALANRKEIGSILPADGGDCEEALSQFANVGIDIDSLAAELQDEGAKVFIKSWNELMSVIDPTGPLLEKAAS